ncbi:MAG: DinB family protein [Chitinophagaceae bacterium]|nr:DinB family protein [Chitinophagaceae bacterium]
MNHSIKESTWKQFGAGIDMLENAIMACPSEHWNTDKKFWHSAYHCLFFLDYYLTMEPAGFWPPPPFTLSEFEDAMPERVYTKEELITYLQFNRNKCHQLITGLTEEKLSDRWINESGTMNYSVFEILLYNMRHVQHHAAQLNLLLRQTIHDAPGWIFQTNNGLI